VKNLECVVLAGGEVAPALCFFTQLFDVSSQNSLFHCVVDLIHSHPITHIPGALFLYRSFSIFESALLKRDDTGKKSSVWGNI
jgi:hypothetical protein